MRRPVCRRRAPPSPPTSSSRGRGSAPADSGRRSADDAFAQTRSGRAIEHLLRPDEGPVPLENNVHARDKERAGRPAAAGGRRAGPHRRRDEAPSQDRSVPSQRQRGVFGSEAPANRPARRSRSEARRSRPRERRAAVKEKHSEGRFWAVAVRGLRANTTEAAYEGSPAPADLTKEDSGRSRFRESE